MAARNRPQPVNQAQDLGEQSSEDSDICELECEVAAARPWHRS